MKNRTLKQKPVNVECNYKVGIEGEVAWLQSTTCYVSRIISNKFRTFIDPT